jgi:hypothetical protein
VFHALAQAVLPSEGMSAMCSGKRFQWRPSGEIQPAIQWREAMRGPW